ncbi:5171_t:CDS:2 [Racocetra fulgida]|uniref:5171_t:CDS:1 n=1 Tax=Racocetra fulgida TaxID=60492 RepID=A0A9N8ZU84_9GLOM|nr:5171_t:CDS:2 [Racocetra fulgida]
MSNSSLLDIVRQKLTVSANEFRSNCLYYTTDKISVMELSTILKKNANYCRNTGIKLEKKRGMSWRETITEYLTEIDRGAQLNERPPIVSIMGHVDHGKTTLLDTIRNTHLQEKEVGGITQKITVSPITFHQKKIIFLDTPGHSDFMQLRQHGISLTDLVVLVISASEGIMPQTNEIITYLREYHLPVIVFINHKKPSETDNERVLNKIKTQLQERELNPLDWGGEIIVVSGSVKKKEDVEHLCENILLLADYKTNWQRPASGVVINSYSHPQAGTMLTELLIQGGRLQEKNEIFLNGRLGSVKIIFDLTGRKLSQAFPGDLVRIVGCNFPAELGNKFLNVNLIFLADSQNSLEVLNSLVKDINNFSVVHSTVGKITDSVLNLAKITQSIILAFGYQFSTVQEKIFRENHLTFFSSKIIYEITDKLKIIQRNQQREKKLVEKIRGAAQVSQIFHFSKVGKIAGCQVISGKIARNNLVHVFRNEKPLFTGSIRSLESNKVTVKEVVSGQECGIVLKGFSDFQINDQIVAFQRQEERPTLSGKSALANVLTNTDKFFEGRIGWNITSQVQVEEFFSEITDAEGQTITYRVIDLPGTDNTKLSLAELFAEIKKALEECGAQLHQIFFLYPGRSSNQQITKAYKLLKKIISPSEDEA